MSILERFRQVVRLHAAHTALAARSARYTYDQLDALSDRLAACLDGFDVAAGSPVVLLLPRSPGAVIAMIGVLKIGAYYVPVDPAGPTAIVNEHLRELGARVVLTLPEYAAHLQLDPDLEGIVLVEVGRDGVLWTRHDVLDRRACSRAVAPDSPAYAMFTSGSTGRPKGVLVPHQAIRRLVVETNYIELNAQDRVLQMAPITFDASTFEIWGALLNGATLVVEESPVLDLNAMGCLVREEQVTVMWLTAALFHLVVRNRLPLMAGLRVLLAGGDVLQPESVRTVLSAFPSLTVINGYGPTENTTFTCCHAMTAATPPGATVPIGKPITGTTVRVLDENGRPVRRGEAGVLYAGGIGLALGYLNDPERTRAAFVDDPDGQDRKLYRTGDLVRERDDGTYEFIGRLDRQVKIRGYRVSVEQVQQVLAMADGVEDAIVEVGQDELGEKRLVAFVQSPGDPAKVRAAVRQYLRQRLAGYMIPDVIEVQAALPLTANGKVNRKRLMSSRETRNTGEEHERIAAVQGAHSETAGGVVEGS
ncbi:MULTISPECIES: amino acid adenylation domain-containing protein [Burkholderia]|uniref:amino acid adenylation domain-containing protein n=1 Tax=Burkholderia TaxID=32008 RepID=UPI000B7ADB3C|nr:MULTISPECIES: amino acid adenylation domain-containing protein [Burkholderia]MBY4723631.1 amino acid adenylation domain-containing protein [Burkholderia contaminans]MCI3968340.1 amino acid adenylation domain-containing protein [Burkholderia sp. HI4860]MDN7791213.1 amino acid adenylation domain-containing protein [Burkholderia contaminans]OXI94831.1 peptide synthetase [Burkholderia sp. AU33647]